MVTDDGGNASGVSRREINRSKGELFSDRNFFALLSAPNNFVTPGSSPHLLISLFLSFAGAGVAAIPSINFQKGDDGLPRSSPPESDRAGARNPPLVEAGQYEISGTGAHAP